MAGTIAKRSNNTWLVRIFLGRDAKGRTRHFNKTIHGTKKDAQRYLNAKLREKDLGQFVLPASDTLEAYFDYWLPAVAKPRVSEATFRSYACIAESYIKPALGTVRLCDLSPDRIQRFYGSLTNRHLAARTVRYVHSVLASALDHGERQGMIGGNPCRKCELPRTRKSEMKYYSPVEVKAFLDSAKESRYFSMFVLAIETGMRPSEYLGLMWRDVNLNSGQISVRRALKFRPGGGFYFAAPKTAGSSRLISISSRLVAELKKHRLEQLTARLKIGSRYRENDLVFANELGDPIRTDNLRKREFLRIVRRAGLPQIRLYDLRHTSATLLLSEGEHPKVVAERLGHASTQLTLDTYSHVLPNMQKAATGRLERLMFGT